MRRWASLAGVPERKDLDERTDIGYGPLIAFERNDREARLACLLGSDLIEIEVLDDQRARTAGQLCGVDHGVLTSDADDLRRLDSTLRYVPV